MPIQFGVPQDSVLGPLLFIMYINALPLAVKGCSVELYADDALFFAGQSVSEIESRLSTDLDRLISWFRCNHLMLNVSRTKILLIGAHQRLNTVDSFSVVADNTFLERVDSFKYLGVTMDETFSWKEDVSLLS